MALAPVDDHEIAHAPIAAEAPHLNVDDDKDLLDYNDLARKDLIALLHQKDSVIKGLRTTVDSLRARLGNAKCSTKVNLQLLRRRLATRQRKGSKESSVSTLVRQGNVKQPVRIAALVSSEFRGNKGVSYSIQGGMLLACRRALSNASARGIGFALLRGTHHSTVTA